MKSGKTLKFCVQKHAARRLHYDFRLEYDGVAVSWAVPKGPSMNTQDKRLAVHVEDHPVDYMDFEGDIPKGEYGAGKVELWDSGVWEPKGDFKKGFKEGSLKFTLFGDVLKGGFALVKLKGETDKDEWLLIKEKDEFSKNSIKNPFSKVEVMLAKKVDELPKGKGWIFEQKFDGHRTVAYLEEGKCNLYTRNCIPCSDKYPKVCNAIEEVFIGRAAVLDGEIVAFDERGRCDFSALSKIARGKGNTSVVYVLFDLLSLDGVDLRGEPLKDRREKLEKLLKNSPRPLFFSRAVKNITSGQLKILKEQGMEGIVGKRENSLYCAGKGEDWVKIKFRGDEEFLICGYTLSDEGTLKSLLLGEREDGKINFVGKVGTGFSEDEKRELLKLLQKIEQKTCPIEDKPKLTGAFFVKAQYFAQVAFAERTSSGLLRQPSFKGLRLDKFENEEKVALTHPEKMMYPKDKITKGDVYAYYNLAASKMLKYLKERTLSLVCCPDGIEGEKFFRRHYSENFEFVLQNEKDFYVKDERGILSLVQNNAIEFHMRGKKVNSDLCDLMLFDLDPDENLPQSKVREGAKIVREILQSLNLSSFLKTSGGKGYHIAVPFKSGLPEEDFRAFAKDVALLCEREAPKLFLIKSSKADRRGKIFLDYMRNSPGATFVCPYSLRAREKAPVSMPISWEELKKISPAKIKLKEAASRMKAGEDPWKNFFLVKAKQTIKLK